MKKQVLVTGAAGFIGTHLVELLVREGFSVRALVRYNSSSRWPNISLLPRDLVKEVELVVGDVCDPGSVQRAMKGCSWVFHLAALIGIPYSYVAPASYVQTNISGTLNVLEACRSFGVERLIHTSTSETYGSAQFTPMSESHPIVGQSPYSASKIAADKLAESYWRSFEVPVTTVRPFNTYGPRQSQRAIIPTIIAQALAGGALKLGNLDPVRDLTFVTDTARGFLSAAMSQKTTGEVINLGVGRGASVGELVVMIGTILGRQLEVVQDAARVRPAASEVDRLISDNRKAWELMQWRPEVSLEAGLAATCEHVRSHPDSYGLSGYVI